VTRRTAAALAVLTAAAGIVVLTGPDVLRVAGGLLLALGLPGLALTTALFRDRISLTTIERVVLVPALSLATLVLGGMAAWVVGLPLRRETWLAVSALVTLGALATTVFWPVTVPVRSRGRMVKLPTPGDSTLILPVFLDRQRAALPLWRRVLPARPQHTVVPLMLVAALLISAGWYSAWTSVRTHDVTVTSLSALPPSAANGLGERSVAVTATGLATGIGAYALVVTSPAGAETSRQELTAEPDGSWTGNLTIPGGERTTIGLYRTGEKTPYRTLIISAKAD
jgi:hypothetical protein